MSLYYDAAAVFSSEKVQGSLKSRIYGLTDTKSKPAQVYALIAETAKCDVFLKEVIDKSELLQHEHKLTPLLALFLCHDHFFAKSGIAAPAKHPLRQSVEKHKARLQSEFTRARLLHKCVSTEALKELLGSRRSSLASSHPRWARINPLRGGTAGEVIDKLPQSKRVNTTQALATGSSKIAYCEDEHIPNLLAFTPTTDLTRTAAYREGKVILQDKASCFPAHLLLGDEEADEVGDMIDGCAAPGNKTTHVAAIASNLGSTGKIYACERDPTRSKTLQAMVAKAGADNVEVLAKQDFLALDPMDARFHNVTHLVLDPSCSGSGILRREDIPDLALPTDPRASKSSKSTPASTTNKKRKRDDDDTVDAKTTLDTVASGDEQEAEVDATQERLEKLSNLQTRIVEHAMKFPAAKRITYSTCSIHEQENEVVVSRLLTCDIARERGWTVLKQSQQVEGLKTWPHRGVRKEGASVHNLSDEELKACIRCYPDDEQGTMGFFVCAFVRQGEPESELAESPPSHTNGNGGSMQSDVSDDDSWEGFD